ncbi:tyrosine--tRNA ligase [Patescibacteria group bacterium]|nr:tyrosine--tRNA ligase [Patescibacteria group bacterium]MBU0777084.1 tyrosine--tRNA ligase [Patescibacteria group bacterium]MBU0845778.1 tyrosine--tRNA ligase [Patescibacteria group bacterium]MBU0922805.1 tyrosine--tRNA ligase [Patescibacteria group bacterium]MBU1066462.1 tyrosine--tRNA ligase [Patescibacteria group bacterium]
MSEKDKEIEKVLTRGVANILPTKEGLASLMAKKKITLYQGFDPSSKNLHIGNWIGIRKLAQFQQLGHQVIFLIGDFTGMIGDPTDKSAARKKMSKEQARKNAKEYTQQVGKTLKFTGSNAAKVLFNSEWLSKLSFEEVVELASNFTVQQMLERDFFQDRIKKNKPIHLHEFFYPLMQGYDCVAMDVDLEIGGSDQLFNMLAGRNLMKALKNKEKFVLTMKLLTDPSGEKMGKSEGNVININDTPNDIFGQIMALPDNLLELGVELLTDLPLETLKKKPLVVKNLLAYDVVEQLYGKQAKPSQEYFDTTFRKKSPEYKTAIEKGMLVQVLVKASGYSASEVKRLIAAGAVDINSRTIKNPSIMLKGGEKIKFGKKDFYIVEK